MEQFMLTPHMIAQSIFDAEMKDMDRHYQLEIAQDIIKMDVHDFQNAVLNEKESLFGIDAEDIHTAMINILLDNFIFEQEECYGTGFLEIVAYERK